MMSTLGAGHRHPEGRLMPTLGAGQGTAAHVLEKNGADDVAVTVPENPASHVQPKPKPEKPTLVSWLLVGHATDVHVLV